jgi:hypothetical protein
MKTLAILTILAAASTLRAETPASSNAALGYWRAFSLVSAPEADDAVWTKADEIAKGKAAWGDPGVAALVDKNAGAYFELHKASLRPSCDFGLAYEDGFEMLLPHLAKARQLSTLNLLRAARVEAAGSGEEAVEAWLDGLRMARHLASDPVLISQLVANLVFTQHLDALIRFVGRGDAAKAQLARIAEAVGGMPAYGWDWGAAIQMEKDCSNSVMKTCLEAKDPKEAILQLASLVGPIDEKGGGKPDVGSILKSWGVPSDVGTDAVKFREYVQGCAKDYDALMDSVAAALRKPAHEGQPLLDKLGANLKGSNLLINMLAPATTALGGQRARLEVLRAGLLALVATARYRAEKGKEPASLDGLGVPDDPFTGKPLVLEANAGGWVIRSEGKDKDGKHYEFVLKK